MPQRVSPWVKLAVALHIVAITSWTLPHARPKLVSGEEKLRVDTSGPAPFARSLGQTISDGTLLLNERYLRNSPQKFYLLPTGFWQYWDMFSPNPSHTDLYGSAIVTYRNGAVRVFGYPRMYEMSVTEKYLNERYRKFFERASQDARREIWPKFAERIAALATTDPANPVVKVVLRRHFQEIAPPGEPQGDYQVYEYHTHVIEAGATK